ncbi:MAG: Phosphate-specific transport system accessory protein PhoU [Gammaproteobacteria bacterium]|nr:Phosphate-specific transport system accessory protein PhoU [Gammaproteobacteria bacterium]
MSHYEQRLQQDLDNIQRRVGALARDAEQAVANSLQAVKTGSRKLAYRTILEDGKINRAHTELNKACFRFIAVHLPSAGPLRLVESVVRTSIQLERLGDYAVTISREAIQMSKPPKELLVRQLELISRDVLLMLDQSISAFSESNEEKARTTMNMASSIEPRMDVVYSDLIDVGDSARVRDSLSMFVIFNMVKRVSDQAKNICEEALFAISGEYKQAARHKILFVDEEGSRLAPMAVAIARKLFPDSADYLYTGRQARPLDSATVSFMQRHGYELESTEPVEFDPSPEGVGEYFVVVSLDSAVASYFPTLPFHTSALEWDVEPDMSGIADISDDSFLEELYRGIVANVSDLVEMMTGKGAV